MRPSCGANFFPLTGEYVRLACNGPEQYAFFFERCFQLALIRAQ